MQAGELEREWSDPPPVEVPAALGQAVGGHPLVARTLVRRGITSVEAALAYLDPAHYAPASPTDLPGMDMAVARLRRAIRAGERICVWGDFDVDGQTATALLVSALQALDADVIYRIPLRATESHGISIAGLEQTIMDGTRLVLTCDTGISAHDAVARARQLCVDVIVTDHHELPSTLPPACAIVNPKMLPLGHSLRELPGVGVAYQLASALHTDTSAGLPPEAFLDLTALGIVADLAELSGDTRHLLQRGLEALRHTSRAGLQALMELAEMNPQWLTEEHIAFVLAPRLNALGRLADASAAVELLTTTDLARARILAAELEGLNARRKLLTEQVTQAAEAQLAAKPALLEFGALVVAHPAWPAGVLGLVAGRLAERYGRPAVVIGGTRGSARSVPDCNITEALAAHAHLLDEYGGHPMAAGFSIQPDQIEALRRGLSDSVQRMVGATPRIPPLQIDEYLPLDTLTLELAEQLERLAPFGPGNSPLVLASRWLRLLRRTPVGRNDEHLQLIVADEQDATQKVIWWQGTSLQGNWAALSAESRFDLAYTIRTSNFRGQREVQIEWMAMRALETAAPPRLEPPAIEVVDCRNVANRCDALAELRTAAPGQEDEPAGDTVVWAEADHPVEVEGLERHRLPQAAVLVIYTTPPGPAELRAAVARVAPRKLYLFTVDPALDDLDRFLARLAGLVKHVLRHAGGEVELTALAAATAQRETTVQAGLDWLAARGYLDAREDHRSILTLTAGRQASDEKEAREAAIRLSELLQETAAFRTYIARASAEALLALLTPKQTT